YGPNNAILIVAGDVSRDDVRALAQEHYGVIPANPLVEARSRPQEPPHLSERRLVFSDPRISQPYVIRSYRAPERDSGDQAKAAALSYLSEILGGSSATSVLGQKLEFEERKAVYTSAFYDGVSLDDSSFGLVIVPVPGRSVEEAEADLDAVIAKFLEDGVDPEQFDRIKRGIRASRIYARDSLQGRARRYGEALTAGLTVDDIEQWPDVLDAVTPEDVLAAARALFDKRRSVTGYALTSTEEVTQ
ncbi:MAG: insulinase family protein, partial [Pseudomonadota bacterium]